MGNTNHKEQDLLTIAEFMEEMKLTRRTVNLAIGDGRIKPTYIGRGRHTFISWKAHKNLFFKSDHRRDTK